MVKDDSQVLYFSLALTVVLIASLMPSQTTVAATVTTIVPPGDTIQLSPSEMTYVKETFQSSVQIAGSFSTSYSVSLYIMTANQFTNFLASGYVAVFSANKGQGPPTAVDWNLQPGQYYFVIVNPWPIQSTFTTSDGIQAFPPGSAPSGGSSGIPEFPAQLGFALVATVVMVSTYVLARRGVQTYRRLSI